VIHIKKNIKLIPLFILVVLVVAACGPAETVEEEPTAETETAEESETAETELPTAAAPSDFEVYGEADEDDYTTTDSGLQYFITEEGDGPAPESGEVVTVHYTGYLTDGSQFDSSLNSGEPFSFPVGRGLVIPGWDEGIGLLNLGDKARLVIPPDLGYGAAGAGNGIIPPDSTLVFDVELVDIRPGSPESPTDVAEDDYTTTDSGLQYIDLVEGDGAEAENGQQVSVH
jgi:peptidylprolyl isomerase